MNAVFTFVCKKMSCAWKINKGTMCVKLSELQKKLIYQIGSQHRNC